MTTERIINIGQMQLAYTPASKAGDYACAILSKASPVGEGRYIVKEFIGDDADTIAAALQPPASSDAVELGWQPMSTAPRVKGLTPLSDECITIIGLVECHDGKTREVKLWWTGGDKHQWCAMRNAYHEHQVKGWKFKSQFLQDYFTITEARVAAAVAPYREVVDKAKALKNYLFKSLNAGPLTNDPSREAKVLRELYAALEILDKALATPAATVQERVGEEG